MRIVLLAISGMFLAACSTSVAGSWNAAEPAGAHIELSNDGSVAGSDGCNQFSGSWHKDGSTITFSSIVQTEMYCDGVNDWLTQLHAATVTDSTMTVFNEAGENIGELKR
ncbi:hypothetical protein N24_0239 [Corynebacterium suranareeae]|uniref:DUF306 domain-containing protein n=1 Tax=Corynebacterium suranareeae TaxID=2506452 RepID=A0A160PPG0_9CORY|nr:META domain-containing protein [Corynebacterium suranareeae]BAU94501.1 hypothetical protein N24_0239 [Corynebacterium suranareeae]